MQHIEDLQQTISPLPDYGLPGQEGLLAERVGTTVSGILGSILVLLLFSLLTVTTAVSRRFRKKT